MKADSDLLDVWLADVPVRWRPWFKGMTIGIILFGAVTTLLWYIRG